MYLLWTHKSHSIHKCLPVNQHVSRRRRKPVASCNNKSTLLRASFINILVNSLLTIHVCETQALDHAQLLPWILCRRLQESFTNRSRLVSTFHPNCWGLPINLVIKVLYSFGTYKDLHCHMTRRSQVIGSLSTQTHKLIITYLQVNLPSQIKWFMTNLHLPPSAVDYYDIWLGLRRT